MISTLRRGLAPLIVPALLAAVPALAQQPLPPQPIPQQQQSASQNPACSRLEAQLGAFDRGGGADASRVKQLEDQLNRQQADLDRKSSEVRRAGCEGGFFLFQGPQCSSLSSQMQAQRDTIDRTQQELSRLQSSGPSPEREAQRRAILVALSQNDCGPQYRSAAAQPAAQPARGGLFETLFGANSNVFTPGTADGPSTPVPGGAYKTICVRMCDGFYYPISYASNPTKFADDTRACQQTCPAAEVQLYAHRSGEDINQATNITTQQPYTALPTAFKYRQAFDNACTCKPQGQTWSQAMKGVEDQVEAGDVVVTPERAKQLSQPRFDAQGKPIRQEPARANTRVDPKTGRPAPTAPTPVAAQPMAPTTPGVDDTPDKPDPKRTVRNVGPTFIPAR
jgi:hypothetical protein